MQDRGLNNRLARRVNEPFGVKRVTLLAVAGFVTKIMPYDSMFILH